MSAMLILRKISKASRLGAVQLIESRLQALLQIFQDQRDQRHVRDLIFCKSFADIFRSQSSQMNDGRTADEWPEEAHHEVDRVIRR